VCAVEQVAVYSQVDAVDADEEVLDALRRGEIEFVTLTSSNIARAFLARLDATCRRRIEAGEIKLVSISPVTSEEIKKENLPIAAESRQATVEGIIDALVELARTSTQVLERLEGKVTHQTAGDDTDDVDDPVDAAEGKAENHIQQKQKE
jgi:uroporphyrinogen III methyltransferase/synthase